MRKRQNTENKKVNTKKLFVIELVLAIMLTIVCILIGMSNLLLASNELYPNATDLLGHMTKVMYLSEQVLQGHLASWFPYWYNGATTVQYYVPLSYITMIPLYILTDNVMLTFKLFCGIVLFIGGMGVWAFSYKKIGRFCGLVAIPAFCLQPLLLESLYREGVIAQGPIFAIMPWFLLLFLSCAEKPTKRNYIGATILGVLLILSHAMHAFMVCLSVGIVLFLLILLRKVTMKNFIITISTIVFAGILTAFWSLVGATGFENPGIPYLLPEAAAYTTANIQWFLPDAVNAFFYFSIAISVFFVISILVYIVAAIRKTNHNSHQLYILACIIITVLTCIFSFGMQIPGFRILPFASSMVPGRILTFTAVTAAITISYGVYTIWKLPKVKYLFRPIVFVMIFIMIYEMNPYKNQYAITSPANYQAMKSIANNDKPIFDKGRYMWYGTMDSSEILFSYKNGVAVSSGWNIEGTLQNQVIYNNYVALPLKQYDYIKKQIAFWNIRYLLLNNEYQDLAQSLTEEMQFDISEANRSGFTLYTSKQPSAYYLKDNRNALVISNGMQGLTISFPYLVQGKSDDLSDYTLKELLKFKLIYIVEPQITTLTQITSFENIVETLIDSGVTVMIEPTATKTFDLFDVSVKNEFFATSPGVSTTVECPYNIQDSILEDNSHLPMVRSLYGLDQEYVNFNLNHGAVQSAILGTKKVSRGEVIFVGAHLSQYLDSVYTRNNGINALSNTVLENSKMVESIYTTLFSYYNVEKDFLPKTFDSVTTQAWDYNGGTFSYDSDDEQEITLSITYAPRWSATVDGQAIEVGQRENLITLTLPAGTHKVMLHYGITLYGKIGYAITAFGLVALTLVLLFWKYIMSGLEMARIGLRGYLQFDDTSTETTTSISVYSEESECIAEIASADEEQQENPIAKQVQAMMEDNLSLQNENHIGSGIIQKTIKENDIMIDIIELAEDSEEVIIIDNDMEEIIIMDDNMEEGIFVSKQLESIENPIQNEKSKPNEEEYRSELIKLREQIQGMKETSNSQDKNKH